MMDDDFKATNLVVETSQVKMDELKLNRSMFWEMLIRCAKRKFLDTFFEMTIEGAFERLLCNHILSLHDELDIRETGM
jgi:hypothetical protein